MVQTLGARASTIWAGTKWCWIWRPPLPFKVGCARRGTDASEGTLDAGGGWACSETCTSTPFNILGKKTLLPLTGIVCLLWFLVPGVWVVAGRWCEP